MSKLSIPSQLDTKKAKQAFLNFIEQGATTTNRATFYNKKEEAMAAVEEAHAKLFAVDRSLYATALLYPGLSDYTLQQGLNRLLQSPVNPTAWLPNETERKLLVHTLHQLPYHRALKGLLMLQATKGANAKSGSSSRIRKLILQFVFRDTNLERHAVEYRVKLRGLLQLAWGRTASGVTKSILSKAPTERTAEEVATLRDRIDKYVGAKVSLSMPQIYGLVSFILGSKSVGVRELPLVRAYQLAHQDLTKGKELPVETLNGIRRQAHKSVPKTEVLKVSKVLTKTQKLTQQKAAQKANVKIHVDWRDYDAIRLYLYAYEQGLNAEIRDALQLRARQSATNAGISYERVVVLLDLSGSMAGSKEQRLRPAACALALKDFFVASAKHATVRLVQQPDVVLKGIECLQPQGDSALGYALAYSLKHDEADHIFVISDGYENAPAGRFAEVVSLARKRLGIKTPILHINPVSAMESASVRTLTPDVPALALQNPDHYTGQVLKPLLESDFLQGLSVLLQAKSRYLA